MLNAQFGNPYPPLSDYVLLTDGITGALTGGVWTVITWTTAGGNPQYTTSKGEYRTLNFLRNRYYTPPGLNVGFALFDAGDWDSALYGLWIVKNSDFTDLSFYYLYRQFNNFNFGMICPFAFICGAMDYIEMWGYSPTGKTPVLRTMRIYSVDNVNGQADLGHIFYRDMPSFPMLR